MVRAIRGATTVENNTKEEIWEATEEMLKKIAEENSLVQEDMISITFTLTQDLNACYPAVRAREMGYTDVPLMNMPELNVPGALEKCIRVIILINSDKELKEINHVYLRGAKKLRPDLAK
ncbi:MAG: chorismate mutase [Clostridia bacterium]|nr:chorismate mutase [Clostridia bacterium]